MDQNYATVILRVGVGDENYSAHYGPAATQLRDQ